MLFFPFFYSLLFGDVGLARRPKRGAEPTLLLGKKDALAHGDTSAGLCLHRYRWLPSEAGSVPDTQLGIALLGQKAAVVKPDSWHTQGKSQLFVRVTLFVSVSGACRRGGEERRTLKNILMMNFQLSAFLRLPSRLPGHAEEQQGA